MTDAEIQEPAEATEETQIEETEEVTGGEIEEVPEPQDAEDRESASDDDDIKPDEFFGEHYEDLVKKGEIGDEALAAIAQAQGVPLRQVKLERDSVLLQRTQVVTRMHDAAGGEAQWNEIKNWVAESGSLTEPDVARINKTIGLGGDAALSAVHELRARFERAQSKPGPKPGRKVQGRSPARPGPKPYASMAELTADMGNAKYDHDKGFREEVDARLRASKPF